MVTRVSHSSLLSGSFGRTNNPAALSPGASKGAQYLERQRAKRGVVSSLTINSGKPRANFHLHLLLFVSVRGHCREYFKALNTQGYPDAVSCADVIVEVPEEFDACPQDL